MAVTLKLTSVSAVQKEPMPLNISYFESPIARKSKIKIKCWVRALQMPGALLAINQIKLELSLEAKNHEPEAAVL